MTSQTACPDIERRLLLSALDEDATLSAAERIREATGNALADILACLADLADAGLVSLYVYEVGPTGAAPAPLADPGTVLRAAASDPAALGYELFLAATEQTFARLNALK